MNKKKMLRIGISAVAVCCVLGIGITVVKKTSGKAVKVALVSTMNNGAWYSDTEVADYGTVTTNMKQDIYPDDTLTVTDVYVKAGDTVKIGDRLIAYDTSLVSLELEMKEMQIQGIELNMQNVQKELSQLRGTKTASAENVGNASVQQMSAVRKVTVTNLAVDKTKVLAKEDVKEEIKEEGKDEAKDKKTEENGSSAEKNGQGDSSTETPSSAVERPFPDTLKEKEIYKEITLDAVPYNEDADGTLEKPYRYLCAPGAAVNAKFMLHVLKDGIVCAFDVVDRAENPTKFISCWVLDGKTGQVIIPEEPQNPDTPDQPSEPEEPQEPQEPETPEEPEEPSEPDGTDPADGQDTMTKEELQKEITEKEQKLKELDLSKRTAQLELKQLQKKAGNGVITSTVEGTVKEVLDETDAKTQNKPIISVTGEEGFYVTGKVAETALDQLKEGMTGTVTSWQTGMSYEATVTGVSSTPTTSAYSYGYGANENLSYYPFTMVIHGDAELSNGEGVNLSVEGMEPMDEDAIYLDQMFVREDGNQYYVYKQGENGRLTRQNVEVGKNLSGSLEIVSGLTMDDLIAFPYGRDVKEGARTEETDTLYDYN